MNEIITEKETVEDFLLQHRNKWTFFNVPFEDGQALENLVLKHNSQSILEIGASTGHSTIWLAKAVAKTDGKITSIEIDKERYEQAKLNFERAGVSHLIDLKLGDALSIIPTLNQTFDFVFSDATLTLQPKESYLLFFQATEPKLSINGLYTMHNVTDGYGDDGRFFKYLEKLGTYQTSIIRASQNGISVSRKLK